MIIIKEKHSGNEVYYQKIITSDEGDTSSDIRYRSVTLEKDSVNYYIIYTPLMIIHSNAFSFINIYMSKHADNSKIKAQQALKFLFCFEKILGKELRDFTPADISNLKHFLHGYSPKGQVLQLELRTIRSNQTVNSYLSIYRQYLSFIGIETSFLQKKIASVIVPKTEDDYLSIKAERYKTSEKIPNNPYLEVPMYISVDDFKVIMNIVREKYSLRDELIIRLMYQCGLRIGEVLGLTAEDVKMEKIDGTYVPIAYIRNRVSDQTDQNAKTCMKVYSLKQYSSSDYQTLNYGYQYVVLPQDLYNLIDEYIESVHVAARESVTQSTRYNQKSFADSVSNDTEENYYIFLNSIGSPLHSHSWNELLRKIFIEAGLPLDSNKREHNLNHRFRHGYAMFNVQYLNCKEIELAERMRHKSILSVYKYYRPTVSDQIKIKTEFAKSLYELIPDLKRGNSDS